MEGLGNLITLALTAGQRHETTVCAILMTTGAAKQPNRGRSRRPPNRVVGDKGLSGGPVRHFLHRRGIRFTML
jgi:hypothetical protein